jgi:hypothetical protein
MISLSRFWERDRVRVKSERATLTSNPLPPKRRARSYLRNRHTISRFPIIHRFFDKYLKAQIPPLDLFILPQHLGRGRVHDPAS